MGLFTRKPPNYGRFGYWPDKREVLWTGNYKPWGLHTSKQEWSWPALAELREIDPKWNAVAELRYEGDNKALNIYVGSVLVGCLARQERDWIMPLLKDVGGSTYCQLQIFWSEAEQHHWIAACIVDLNYLQGLNPH